VGLLKNIESNTKNHKRAAHHSIPAFRWELGRTVEKYSKTKHKKGITKAAHHSIAGGVGRTVEKYSRPNTRKESKEQHITQSLLYRWEWVGLLKI
jgi:hypothetical protein